MKTIHRWTAMGMLVMLAHFAGKSWPLLAILGLAAYGYLQLMPARMDGLLKSKVVCSVELAAIVLLTAQLLPCTAVYWQGKGSEIVVPVCILLMAAWGNGGKPERTVGVIGNALAVVLIPVWIALAKNVRLEEWVPDEYRIPVWACAALLLPVAVRMGIEEETDLHWYPKTIAAAVLLWAMIGAVMGNTVENPAWELGRRLMLGQYSRFEMLIAVVMTFGWYALISLLIRCFSGIWREIGGSDKTGRWICTFSVLTIVLLGGKIPQVITSCAIWIAWVWIPIFGLKKTSKKSEKSA